MYRAYMILLLNIKSKLTLISLFSFHYKISYDISDIDQNVSIHISYRSIWPIRSPTNDVRLSANSADLQNTNDNNKNDNENDVDNDNNKNITNLQ